MVWRGVECGIPQKMSRLLRRCVAYLHTLQICCTCRSDKVGIHGLLDWTAENFYLGVTLDKADQLTPDNIQYRFDKSSAGEIFGGKINIEEWKTRFHFLMKNIITTTLVQYRL
jgi:hypothetical protein